MKTSTTVWIVVIIIVLAGAWYFMSSSPQVNTGQPSTTAGVQGSDNQTNTGQQAVPPVVTVAHNATLGDYLVATNGMTLYHYTKDTRGVSNCTGACAVTWPPYTHTVAEPLLLGAGATGTADVSARADQTEQVTYNGMPLYFFKNDAKAGDTTGQGVGGVWYVVKP